MPASLPLLHRCSCSRPAWRAARGVVPGHGVACPVLPAQQRLRFAPAHLNAPVAPRPPPGLPAAFTDVWLRDRLLMLCHLSSAPLMRGALTHQTAMQAAVAGLLAVRWGRPVAARTALHGVCPGGKLCRGWAPSRCLPAHASCAAFLPCSTEGGGRMAEETRRQCQREFLRSRRAHKWAQVRRRGAARTGEVACSSGRSGMTLGASRRTQPHGTQHCLGLLMRCRRSRPPCPPAACSAGCCRSGTSRPHLCWQWTPRTCCRRCRSSVRRCCATCPSSTCRPAWTW